MTWHCCMKIASFLPWKCRITAAHHPCLLDPQRPCWSANHFWNPGSCEVGKLGRLSQLWGSQDGNTGNLKGGLKKTSEPRGCFLFCDYNMFFFTTKDLFLKHIFEHFILQLLEAFKHSNLTFPSQEFSFWGSNAVVSRRLSENIFRRWCNWSTNHGETMWLVRPCSVRRVASAGPKMKQTGKDTSEPRETRGIIVSFSWFTVSVTFSLVSPFSVTFSHAETTCNMQVGSFFSTNFRFHHGFCFIHWSKTHGEIGNWWNQVRSIGPTCIFAGRFSKTKIETINW